MDHNALCLPPRILHNHSPGYNSRPKRNLRQWLCEVMGGKQGALWSMWKWWISYTLKSCLIKSHYFHFCCSFSWYSLLSSSFHNSHYHIIPHYHFSKLWCCTLNAHLTWVRRGGRIGRDQEWWNVDIDLLNSNFWSWEKFFTIILLTLDWYPTVLFFALEKFQ